MKENLVTLTNNKSYLPVYLPLPQQLDLKKTKINSIIQFPPFFPICHKSSLRKINVFHSLCDSLKMFPLLVRGTSDSGNGYAASFKT